MSKHAIISYIKSLVRIVGFVFLMINIFIAMWILIAAEVIGMIEELYE